MSEAVAVSEPFARLSQCRSLSGVKSYIIIVVVTHVLCFIYDLFC